jgi:carbonic anhydrase
MHMHSPAEHSIEGELRDAEAHIVHRNIADSNDYVVVSVTLRVQDTDRTADQALTVMLDKFNGKSMATYTARYYILISLTYIHSLVAGESTPGKDFHLFSPYALLPLTSDKFYTYPGSLTTPPCSEFVTWIVMAQAVGISRQGETYTYECVYKYVCICMYSLCMYVCIHSCQPM